MKRVAGAILLFTLISPPLTQAQETVRVNPGDRVRVRVTSFECFQGANKLQFASFSGDTLWVMAGGQDLGCPTSRITRLEVFRPTSIWKTSAIGLIAGVSAGVLFMEAVSRGDCGLVIDCGFPNEIHVGGGLIGGAVGLLAGVIIGDTKRFGGWKEVPLPPGQPFVQVSAAGRLGFGFSIRLRR